MQKGMGKTKNPQKRDDQDDDPPFSSLPPRRGKKGSLRGSLNWILVLVVLAALALPLAARGTGWLENIGLLNRLRFFPF